MRSSLWTEDISVLYTGNNIRQIVPTKEMTYSERINAIVRLIILSSVLIYLYNRDGRYLLYGVFSICLLTYTGHQQNKKNPAPPQPIVGYPQPPYSVAPAGPYDCEHPTVDNPFANVLLTDYKYNPNRPPACDVDLVSDQIKAAYGANLYRDSDDVDFRKSGLRSFYTMPDTSLYQSGREAFAQACFGSQPTCKEDQKFCRGF